LGSLLARPTTKLLMRVAAATTANNRFQYNVGKFSFSENEYVDALEEE